MSNDTVDLQRAIQIFSFDETRLGSPIAEVVWRTRSEPVTSFTSVAVTRWEMVFTKQHGRTTLYVRGPETHATVSPIPEDAEFLGVQFRLGTFMPDVPLDRLVDGAVIVPGAGTRSFWLNGSACEFPTYENVDVFLKRLARKGLVVGDPIVQAALAGRPTAVSGRTLQRRIRRATGLTQSVIRQIERAERAVALLESGAPILDVVERLRYADQPHLTRSLRRFIGHTPAQIASERTR